MRVTEHIHPDGESSFEFTEITHGEFRALSGLSGAALVDHIRTTAASIVPIHHEPPPVPDDDELM